MKSILSVSVAILTAIFVFISCNKIDTTDLGSGLIPEIDNINTFDTILPVSTNNFFSDDQSMKMIWTELHGAGIIENDPEFGQTTAYFYTSFAPSQSHTYPFVKRDTVKIDSVVLSLAYGGLYGDSNIVQRFEVREVSPMADFQDTGYSITHPDLPVQPLLLGAKPVSLWTLNDTLQYKNGDDTVSTASELRIRLDTAWARRFVLYDTVASDAYNNDSIFQTKFKGLEVKVAEASSDKKAITYFDLTQNERTRITFYCRVQNNGRTDTIAPYFIFKNGMPEANLVRRTPNGGYLANMANGVDNDEKLYIQSTPGSYATVNIPGLAAIPNCVIHRAELIFEKAASAEENIYSPPPRLFIEGLSGDSTVTIRNDFIVTNTTAGYDLATLGGVLNSNRYVFNLTRYTQSIVTKGHTNFTLKVSYPFAVGPYFVSSGDIISSQKVPLIVNPLIAGGRVILLGGGFSDTTKAARLRIIYSKI